MKKVVLAFFILSFVRVGVCETECSYNFERGVKSFETARNGAQTLQSKVNELKNLRQEDDEDLYCKKLRSSVILTAAICFSYMNAQERFNKAYIVCASPDDKTAKKNENMAKTSFKASKVIYDQLQGRIERVCPYYAPTREGLPDTL